MIPIKKSNSEQVYEFCKDIYEMISENDKERLNHILKDEFSDIFPEIQSDDEELFLKLMTLEYKELQKVKERIEGQSEAKFEINESISIKSNKCNHSLNKFLRIIYQHLDKDFIEECNSWFKEKQIGNIDRVKDDINLLILLEYKSNKKLKKINSFVKEKNIEITNEVNILINKIDKKKEFAELLLSKLDISFRESFEKALESSKCSIKLEDLLEIYGQEDFNKKWCPKFPEKIEYKVPLKKYLQNEFKRVLETLYNRIDKKELVRITGVTVCPYCNRNFINVTEEANTSQLDHFFPKNEYPLFALCFYNLIPSCYGCNNKKSTSKFYISPYDESITDVDELLMFSWKPKLADFINNSANIDIIVKDDISEEKLKQLESKDELSVRQKLLKDKYVIDTRNLYKLHTDVVQELLWKQEVYSNSYKIKLEEILATSDKKFSKYEIDRMIVGYYTDKENYGNRPLSKMVTDISKEIGLVGEEE